MLYDTGTALKMNDMLSELYLGENKLTASDGIQLGNIMKHNSALCILDLRNNSLQVCLVASLNYIIFQAVICVLQLASDVTCVCTGRRCGAPV